MAIWHCGSCRASLLSEDLHPECVACLGPPHTKTALTGACCPHCDLSLAVLRAWVTHFSGPSPCKPTPCLSDWKNQRSREPVCKAMDKLTPAPARGCSLSTAMQRSCTILPQGLTPLLHVLVAWSRSASWKRWCLPPQRAQTGPFRTMKPSLRLWAHQNPHQSGCRARPWLVLYGWAGTQPPTSSPCPGMLPTWLAPTARSHTHALHSWGCWWLRLCKGPTAKMLLPLTQWKCHKSSRWSFSATWKRQDLTWPYFASWAAQQIWLCGLQRSPLKQSASLAVLEPHLWLNLMDIKDTYWVALLLQQQRPNLASTPTQPQQQQREKKSPISSGPVRLNVAVFRGSDVPG